MPLSALALVLLAALLHASWNFAAKHAGGDHRFTLITLSAAVHLLYFNALLKGYRVGDLTVVYPLARGSAPLLTALCAVLLGEDDRGRRLLGAGCIAAGVMALAWG